MAVSQLFPAFAADSIGPDRLFPTPPGWNYATDAPGWTRVAYADRTSALDRDVNSTITAISDVTADTIPHISVSVNTDGDRDGWREGATYCWTLKYADGTTVDSADLVAGRVHVVFYLELADGADAGDGFTPASASTVGEPAVSCGVVLDDPANTSNSYLYGLQSRTTARFLAEVGGLTDTLTTGSLTAAYCEGAWCVNGTYQVTTGSAFETSAKAANLANNSDTGNATPVAPYFAVAITSGTNTATTNIETIRFNAYYKCFRLVPA